MNLHWQNKDHTETELDDHRLHDFLFQHGSLSRFIEECCRGRFHIELKNESWCQPLADEVDLLSLATDEITFVRESWLKCDEHRLVYARTIIPRSTYEGESQELMQLGNKPLGNILFNDNTTYRTNMRYAKIPLHCNLHQQATVNSDIIADLWGRQSLFYINDKPLLVTEVFLPTILECAKY